MATRKKAKWLVKLLKVIVAVYLLLILYQLIGNVYSKLSNTHEIQVPKEWNLIVVNRWNELPEDYDVELTELSNGQMVDSRIYGHFPWVEWGSSASFYIRVWKIAWQIWQRVLQQWARFLMLLE